MRKIGRQTRFGTSRAVSSLLTAVILCATVLVIGGAVWAFANNSSSLMGNDYFDEVNEKVDTARERFMVENIEPMNVSCLRVWVYNYGDIGVNVTTCVFRNGVDIGQLTGQVLNGGEMKEHDIPVQTMTKGDELVVKVISSRGTTENESYVIR